jgi:beta-N-acetylhexosaminidase
MKNVFITAVLTIACTFTFAQKGNKTNDDWKKLSLREKIGQTMVMLPDREMELQLGNGSLAEFFRPRYRFFYGLEVIYRNKRTG